jgi:hypothetical protein
MKKGKKIKGSYKAASRSTTKNTKWTTVRVSEDTATTVKRALAASRAKGTGLTLTIDRLVAEAVKTWCSSNSISDRTLASTKVPTDGRSAGAQARAALANKAV